MKEKLTKDTEKITHFSSTYRWKKNAQKNGQQEILGCLFLNTNKVSDAEVVERTSDSAVFSAVPDQTAWADHMHPLVQNMCKHLPGMCDYGIRNKSATLYNEAPWSPTSYSCILLVDKQPKTLDIELNESKGIIVSKSMTA